MMRATLSLFICFVIFSQSKAQDLVVINNERILLSFVEFVDNKGNIITYSDYKGRVSLPGIIEDTVTVQHPGYEGLSLAAAFILEQDTLVLNALPTLLEEVLITAERKGKPKLIYNVKGKQNAVTLSTSTEGTSILTLVRFRRLKYNYLKRIEIKVDRSDVQGNYYFFKPRFYKVQSDTLENVDSSVLENLLPSAQVVKMKKDNGDYLIIDVSRLAIELEEDQIYLVGFTLFSEEGEAMIYSDGNCDKSHLTFIQGNPSSDWFRVACALQVGFEMVE